MSSSCAELGCGEQVEKLGLGWCKVGAEEGARSLADLLMFNTALRQIDLRGNELGDAGAAQICRALKEHSNERLLELDLGYNEIKDDGACFLAQVSSKHCLCTVRHELCKSTGC